MADMSHAASIASDDSLYFANSSGSNMFDSSEDPSKKNSKKTPTQNIPQFMHVQTSIKIQGGKRLTSSGPSGVINLTPGAHTIL
jgi:hypothetical protein